MTDTDKELFELCKRVYELRGWETGEWFGLPTGKHGKGEAAFYTSDYLLEKLPKSRGDFPDDTWLCLEPIAQNKWAASYRKGVAHPTIDKWADTPIKALLKLVIALHGAGELEI
jgi:hypothetical protein